MTHVIYGKHISLSELIRSGYKINVNIIDLVFRGFENYNNRETHGSFLMCQLPFVITAKKKN